MAREPDITELREQSLLATYAMHSRDSLGRELPEPPHPYRGPYQRDRDRIVHSGAFRRLSHKTQVFTGDLGDYHRTRLTHTLEVASIARTMARALRLNEDLVEALALAHDIGHPPFGHSGEQLLDQCLAGAGGFNHNAQALRIFRIVEQPYLEFRGLNLTREVLDGQAHRAGKKAPVEGATRSEAFVAGTEKSGATGALLEVQIVDAADSIAYDAHDADDALEIGLIELDELMEVTLWREASARVLERHPGPTDRHHRRAVVHELIDYQVGDLFAEISKRLEEWHIQTVQDVRTAPPLAQHSSTAAARKRELERFLFERVYRHPQVLSRRREAQAVLRELFDAFIEQPRLLPEKFRIIAEAEGLPRGVADYLAGMTDRFAYDEHDRLVAAAH